MTIENFESWKATIYDRETYLAWVKRWQDEYKRLSAEILALKQTRKSYSWSYREKGEPGKKRFATGKNPKHVRQTWKTIQELNILSEKAAAMLVERQEAKEESIRMKKERLKAA